MEALKDLGEGVNRYLHFSYHVGSSEEAELCWVEWKQRLLGSFVVIWRLYDGLPLATSVKHFTVYCALSH